MSRSRINAGMLVVSLLLAGCSKSPGPEPTTVGPDPTGSATPTQPTARPASSGTSTPTAARSWPRDAPDPYAPCKDHDECWVYMWEAPQPPDPCCEKRVGFLPASRAYAVWMSEYQKRHCAGVRCDPLPMPGAEPNCCVSIPRCVSGKCVLGCDDPTLDAPKVVWHSPECQMPPSAQALPTKAAPSGF